MNPLINPFIRLFQFGKKIPTTKKDENVKPKRHTN